VSYSAILCVKPMALGPPIQARLGICGIFEW